METLAKRFIRAFTYRWLGVSHSVALAIHISERDLIGIVAVLLLLAVIVWRERVLKWVSD